MPTALIEEHMAANPNFCNLEARPSVGASAMCPSHSQPLELTPSSKHSPMLDGTATGNLALQGAANM